jgi:hypothetical protein
MMSCGDLNGSFSLWHISWFEFYQQVGVMPGAIGSQAAAVAVKDKDGIPCGIETVRAVVRKALRRDVPRAVVYFLVNLKHWTLVGQSDRMQRFIGGSRAQGMVEFLAKLLVQNALATALPMGAASRWPGYCSSFGGSDPDPEIPESRKTDKTDKTSAVLQWQWWHPGRAARRGPRGASTVSTRQPVTHGSGEWTQGKSPKDIVNLNCGLAARTPRGPRAQAPSQKWVQVANCGIRPFQVADNEPEEHEDRDVRHDRRCYHDGASLPGHWQGRYHQY